MTSYETIYKAFKKKIEDKDLPLMSDEDQAEMLLGWLQSALAFIELDDLKIKSDFTAKDDTLLEFTDTLYNSEIEVLALYMVVAWYEPKVNSLEHTLLYAGSKDEKWTNQKDHLNAIRNLQEAYRKRARKYFMHYAYRNNDYLNEEA